MWSHAYTFTVMGSGILSSQGKKITCIRKAPFNMNLITLLYL